MKIKLGIKEIIGRITQATFILSDPPALEKAKNLKQNTIYLTGILEQICEIFF